MSESTFSIEAARSRFPALKTDQVYLDNAGGSQVLGDVIDSIQKYLSESNVQMGATYKVGRESVQKFRAGYDAVAKYMNADVDEIVLGGSTTQLLMNLGVALQFPPGSEIIVTKVEHETNVNPWLWMAKRQNLEVKWWIPSAPDFKLTPENLEPLLSEKTKFVACTHVSNILGTIHDVKGIAEKVHAAGALFCVDGVSFAPHRGVDVRAFGVDFYAFSWYKVYGPHIAVLYARQSAQQHVQCLGHYFNPTKSLENKLGLAASNFELTASLPHVVSYLTSDPTTFDKIAAHEAKLSKIVLDYLTSEPKITVHGLKTWDPKIRVPTISFTVEGVGSRKFVERVDEVSNVGIRWGHFYSKRLCEEVLGLGEECVVRISCVHYNTEDEMRGVVEVLKKVLAELA